MDKGTVVTALIIVSVTVAPFLILSYRTAVKKRKLHRQLQQLANAANCSIDSYDSWGNSIIGMDGRQSVLFALQFGENEKPLSVNIPDIKSCSLMHPKQQLAAGSAGEQKRNELGLEICYKLKEKPAAFIRFLAQDQVIPFDGKELQLAKKWCDLISSRIVPGYN